jgi:death-on-curing protein
VSTWRWVRPDVVFAVHDVQLAQHAGLDGVSDENAVRAALARPEQLHTYGIPPPDAAALAAAYAYGPTRTHCFNDGNKRTAWVVARLFLADNGFRLVFSGIDAIRTMEGLATGTVSEAQLTQWFRERIV